MGRKPRIEYHGAVYHVIKRGNNREYIFEGEEQKEFLLGLIKEYKRRMNFELYGFILMDNHYHMIIKTTGAPLQDIMHRINYKYSKYYNYVNSRTGHVFENRYKGILVKEDKYLLSLLRYVHQNPVRARLCDRVSDYQWSSDLYYRKNRSGEIVDIDFIFDIFSKDRLKAIKAYRKFMDADEMEEADVFEEVSFIGEDKDTHMDKITEKVQRKSLDDSLDEILHEVTKDKSIFDEIKTGSRKRYLTDYKQEYIAQTLNANYTMREIGENISVSEAAIFKMNNKGKS
jgi:putative transposase